MSCVRKFLRNNTGFWLRAMEQAENEAKIRLFSEQFVLEKKKKSSPVSLKLLAMVHTFTADK